MNVRKVDMTRPSNDEPAVQPMKAMRALSKMRHAWRAVSNDRWMPTWLVIAAFLSTGLVRWANV